MDRIVECGYVTTKKDARLITDVFIRTLKEALIRGESVHFRGFGVFDVADRAARTSVSPSTKEVFKVPVHKGLKFKPCKSLRYDIMTGVMRV